MALSRTATKQHSFSLNKLRFAVMTIYGVDDMQPFYADVISREISPAEILDIADLIEEKYDRDGYTGADVMLLAMPSANGTITLNVIELGRRMMVSGEGRPFGYMTLRKGEVIGEVCNARHRK